MAWYWERMSRARRTPDTSPTPESSSSISGPIDSMSKAFLLGRNGPRSNSVLIRSAKNVIVANADPPLANRAQLRASAGHLYVMVRAWTCKGRAKPGE